MTDKEVRDILAKEIMGWEPDSGNYSYLEYDDWGSLSIGAKIASWKPDQNWLQYGMVINALPEDWFFHIFLAEGGKSWICEAAHEKKEGVGNSSSFCQAAMTAIAYVLNQEKESNA